jgi:Uma2 family endonuclease
MSEPYQEILEGAPLSRSAPGSRHELICARLHDWVRAGVANLTASRLLAPRSEIRLSPDTILCPDLALIAVSTGKLWLAAEVVSSDDHRADTVVKKEFYEALKLPRLWMIDPRYDNVEVYHGSPYGLILKSMLAGRETLTEELLPEFQLTVSDLFHIPPPQS